MIRSRTRAALAALLALAPLAQAQSFELLLLEGDAIAGGTADFFYALDIADDGSWLVEADIGLGFGPFAVVGPEGVVWEQGVSVAEPPLATTSIPIDIARLPGDHVAVMTRLDEGVSPVVGQNEALYVDGQAVIVRNAPVELQNAPAGSVVDDLIWMTRGPEGQLLISARYRPGGRFPARHCLIGLDQREGQPAGLRLLADHETESTALDAEVIGFGVSQRSGGLRTITTGSFEVVDGGSDEAVHLGGRLIAREGEPSPVPGATWGALKSTGVVDANPSDSWMLAARIVSSVDEDAVIAVDDAPLVRIGESLPAVAPYAIERFTTSSFGLIGHVQLTNDGQTLWSANWDDPDTSRDTGLFLDHELVVQEGVDTVGFYTIRAITPETYRISDNGRFLIMHCAVQQGSGLFKRAVVRVDLMG